MWAAAEMRFCTKWGGKVIASGLLMAETLLVVDDDAAARYALTRVFEKDYRVVGC